MILEFANKLVNVNSISWIGQIDDPTVEEQIQKLDIQIESFKSPWYALNIIGEAMIETLKEEKKQCKQLFHIDVFLVDGSELRESFESEENRNTRLEEIKTAL